MTSIISKTKTQASILHVSPEIGTVSAEYMIPEAPKCIMSIAHGAGAGMNHPFLVNLAKALSDHGIATLRFNFPFAEQHKKRPDSPNIAQKTIVAAILSAKELLPGLPLFVSGKSFGGRMTSQYLSITHNIDVRGIIFFGFPLHPPGKPSTYRADHLKEVKVPMLFIQGTKDALATWQLIENVCGALPNAELKKMEGADHSFKGREHIFDDIATITNDWIEKQLTINNCK